MGLYPAVLKNIRKHLEHTWLDRSGRRRRQRPDNGFSNAPAMVQTLEQRVLPTTVWVASTQNGTEGGQNAVITLQRDDTSGALGVSYEFLQSYSTANPWNDFAPLGGTVTFADNSNTAIITLNLTNDDLEESTEYVTIALSDPLPSKFGSYSLGSTKDGVVNIYDDDVSSTVTVKAISAHVTEGDGQSGFEITRTSGTGKLTVGYQVGASTAMAGSDYNALAGSVTFNDGETKATVTVTPINDTLAEEAETVILVLDEGPPPGKWGHYVRGTDKSATVTIHDNDVATVNVSATANALELGANGKPVPGVFQFTRNNANGVTTVNYTVNSGSTAYAGADYQALSGTITFNIGEYTKEVEVLPLDDSLPEMAETVAISLNSPMMPGKDGYYIQGLQTSATVTITDDDAQTVTITAIDPDAAEANQQTGTFRITRSNSVGALTVNYAVNHSQSISSSGDYNSLGTSVTFNNGEATKDIVLTPVDDTLHETQETVVVMLTDGAPAGKYGYYTIGGPSAATVTIADNDNNPPVITALQTTFSAPHDQTLTVATPVVGGTDPDGDPITLQLVSDTAHGTLTLNSDATFTYTPTAQFVGTDAFQVHYVDSQGMASNTVTITLSMTNLSPTFANGQTAVSVNENTAVGTTILDASATDLDDPTLTYSILSGNGGGYFSIDQNGQLKVASALNYEAMSQHQFSLVVEAMDSLGATVTRTITVEILNVNEPPVLLNFAFSTTDGVVYTFTGQVIDEAFGACTIEFDGVLDGHTSGCNPGGTFSYTVTLGGGTTGLVAAKAIDPLGQSSANSYVLI